MVVESATAFATCNIGYPRAVLEQTGGFDEGFRRAAGEDTDLGLRAVALGASAVFVPEALVHHDVRPSSWVAAVKETRKWVDVPRFAASHQPLEGVLHSRHWWRQTHPVAVLAGAGVLGTAATPYALVAVLPWLRLRTTHARVQARRRQWPWVLPAMLVVDLAEVAVLARGSVKHRRLVL
jgi:GT2 family glycosyltransferase